MLVLSPQILTNSSLHNVVVATTLSLLSCIVPTIMSVMSPIINSRQLDYDKAKFSGTL